MWVPIAHAQKQCQLESRALFGGNEEVLVECFAFFARQIARRIRFLEYWKSLLPCLAEQFNVRTVASGEYGWDMRSGFTDASICLRAAESGKHDVHHQEIDVILESRNSRTASSPSVAIMT
jgi:hypothetical protein